LKEKNKRNLSNREKNKKGKSLLFLSLIASTVDINIYIGNINRYIEEEKPIKENKSREN